MTDQTAPPNTEAAAPKRKAHHYVVPVVAVAVILLGPVLLNLVVPADSLGTTVLIVLLAATLLLGLLDGLTFASSWSFPGTVGAAYLIAMNLFFNSGTWIYLPVVAILAALGGWLGNELRSRREAKGGEGDGNVDL